MPSFPGPSSSSPSQMLLQGGPVILPWSSCDPSGGPSMILPEGYPALLLAVLPSWYFLGGEYPGPPSMLGGGVPRPSVPGPSSSPSQLVLPWGRGSHVTLPIMHLMLPVCSPTDGSGLMQLLIYCCPSASWEKVTWDPQSWTD